MLHLLSIVNTFFGLICFNTQNLIRLQIYSCRRCFLVTVVLARFTGLGTCDLSKPRFAAAFGVDDAGVVVEVLPLCGSEMFANIHEIYFFFLLHSEFFCGNDFLFGENELCKLLF